MRKALAPALLAAAFAAAIAFAAPAVSLEDELPAAPPGEELSFVNTELSKVVEVFSRLGGLNLFLAQDLDSRRITFFARGLSLKQALDNMLVTNGLRMRRTAPRTYLIYPVAKGDEFEEPTDTEVFFLDNRDPKMMINILKGVGKRTRVFMNEQIDAVVMMDTPENLAVARRLVAGMDHAREQVLVDVKLVEVQRGALRDLGPQLGNTALTFGEFKALPTARTNVILQSLVETNRATILAAPRVRVLDKEKAEINVGDKIPIEITTSSRSAAGDDIQLNKTVQWENVGIKLRLEILKIHERREITLKLYNEVSSVVRYTAAGYPEIRSRNAETILTLKDAETVVFGGLINTSEKKTVQEVPLLARLPGLGRVFSRVKSDQVQTEIVMFVTPAIGRGADERIASPTPASLAAQTVAEGGGAAVLSEPARPPALVPSCDVIPAAVIHPADAAPVKVEKPAPAADPVTRMGELVRRLRSEAR